MYILPPYVGGKKGEWYKGTANSIFQNIEFIKQFDPKYIVVISGDHIYKMDYSQMLEFHKRKCSSATIAVVKVPWQEASRFRITIINEEERVIDFEEKPKNPMSNSASMGIYIFNWDTLSKYLIQDDNDTKSNHDFGKNVIPQMLHSGENIYAYCFSGYWKDVGTIQSLWEANMDLLETHPAFDLYDQKWRIYTRNLGEPPNYIFHNAWVRNSIVSEGSVICGEIEHLVIFSGVNVQKNSYIKDSVIMPRVSVGENSRLENVIIGEGTIIGKNCNIGFGNDMPNDCYPDIYTSGITVIGEDLVIPDGTVIGRNAVVEGSMDECQVVPSVGCIGKKGEAI